MSAASPIELAEEAIQKLDDLTLVDKKNKDKAEARPPRESLSSEERRRMFEERDEERRRQWEEKQAAKEVLETKVTGKVKWYSVRGKYGFIARGEDQKDVFVHQTAIAKSEIVRHFLRTLADGEEVVFDILNGDKGPEAANVTGPDGGDVKGSKYFRILLTRNNTRRNAPREGEEKKKPTEGETGEGGVVKAGGAGGEKRRKRPNRNRRPRTMSGRRQRKSETESETAEKKEGGEVEGEGAEKDKGDKKKAVRPSSSAAGDVAVARDDNNKVTPSKSVVATPTTPRSKVASDEKVAAVGGGGVSPIATTPTTTKQSPRSAGAGDAASLGAAPAPPLAAVH